VKWVDIHALWYKLGDERFQDLLTKFCNAPKRARLARPHEAGVADNVGGQNGGEPTFQPSLLQPGA
jgi:hypothetical protein